MATSHPGLLAQCERCGNLFAYDHMLHVFPYEERLICAGCDARGRLEKLDLQERERHQLDMKMMMGLMNRIKVLGSLVIEGGVDVVVNTCEDGNQALRDENGGGSAFTASIVCRSNGVLYMVESHSTDPGTALEGLLARIEAVAHTHVKRDRDELERKKSQLGNILKAIENKTALP